MKKSILVLLGFGLMFGMNAQVDRVLVNGSEAHTTLNLLELELVLESLQAQINQLQNIADVAGGTADLSQLWTAVDLNTTGRTTNASDIATNSAAIGLNTAKTGYTELLVSANTSVAANTAKEAGIANLGTYLTVTANDLTISNANLSVVSGAGTTDGTINGLGNVIIGYDEDFGANIKSGSHNLVVGKHHTYSSYGGIVVGYSNSITNSYSSVSGGSLNLASGLYSSVSGGYFNTASAGHSSVSGGHSNTAEGGSSSVSGGVENTASDNYSSVSGGWENLASSLGSSVLGGSGNTASGEYSSVSGGSTSTAEGNYSSVSGGSNNTAVGHLASVIGDYSNSYMGSVAGGGDVYSVDGTSLLAGCMDQDASNYDQFAIYDDGSCYVCSTINELALVVANSFACDGISGSITITVDVADPATTYDVNWVGPDNFTSTDEDIVGLDSGTYTVTVTDSNNCIAIAVFVVDQEICIGDN